MVFRKAVFILLLSYTLNRPAAATHWTYDDVQKWAEDSPECAGRRQSPVDILAPKSFKAPSFLFKNYGLMNVSLENTGHSLKARLHLQQEEQRPRLAGGGLSGTFLLDSFHFHWGSEDSKGSEHLLGSCAFPAEMHLVHFRRKYGSVEEALEYDNGLAVLGVWLVPGRDSDSSTRGVLEDDGTSFSAHTTHGLDQTSPQQDASNSDTSLKEDLENDGTDTTHSLDQTSPQHDAKNLVATEDDHSAAAKKWFRALTPSEKMLDNQLIAVDLRQLIPFDDRAFYRYNGSLTTPPCTANVEWTIFENPVTVPLRFLKGLRALANKEGELLSNNFRPSQSLGKREVLYSGTKPKKFPLCTRPKKSHASPCTSIPSLGSFGTVAPGKCPEGQDTSPADLHLANATPTYAKRLRWKRRGGCANAVVTLEDRLLKVAFPGEEAQWELSGGLLTTPYHLNHMLFRWGSDHHLGGLSFPLEVQLVHYSSDSDDVVVVSKFFQEPIDLPDVLDSLQHTEPSRNRLLEVVFEAAQELSKDPGIEEEDIPSPDVSELMGDASSFYEYSGTFPDAPCLGNVTWMVLRTAGEIARTQLEELRELTDESGDKITSNNRPLKQLGNRNLSLRVNKKELVHEYNVMLQRPKRKSTDSGALQQAAVSMQLLCLLVLVSFFVARLGLVV
ncbi:uncharacterized protein LOC125028139 isoform X2 [Penaeus chinensis]|uniref:uncharacterized protein LOC125028139 isoform X2 n=1 Tax=Penaeus chinensis TaxID=139456 RepID=UPI001FB79E81|nr:uncharacterized protein LOC125028139 isoform X2 [Penaeus chinensis]